MTAADDARRARRGDRRGRFASCSCGTAMCSGWHFPGGGVEVGETFVDALARELEEEACVAVDRARRSCTAFFSTEASSRRDHVAVYVIRDFAVLGERAPDREIEEARFFPRAPARGNDRGHAGADSPRFSTPHPCPSHLVRTIAAQAAPNLRAAFHSRCSDLKAIETRRTLDVNESVSARGRFIPSRGLFRPARLRVDRANAG